uniref:Uncharacterized protein n=1 Tax=Anguilla anguilla TaxID=7936 RepID=A0A0E9X213_ANGAN
MLRCQPVVTAVDGSFENLRGECEQSIFYILSFFILNTASVSYGNKMEGVCTYVEGCDLSLLRTFP